MDFWISKMDFWISKVQIYKLISPFLLEFRIPSLFVKRFMGFWASVFWHSGCLDFSSILRKVGFGFV